MTVDAVTDLSCMDGANVAAVALQMQETALEAEERIYQLEKRLRAGLNRPTKIQRSTATITGYAANPFVGDQALGPFNTAGNWVTDFDNTGFSGNVDDTSRTMFGILGEGLYEFGISVNVIASGAVNDNTYRLVKIVVYREDPTAVDGVVIYDIDGLLLLESNTAVGVDFTVTGQFRMEATDRVVFALEHDNVGSTLNSTLGAVVWMTKISSDDAVVVG